MRDNQNDAQPSYRRFIRIFIFYLHVRAGRLHARYANIKIDQGVVVGKKIKPTGNKYRDLGSPRLQLPSLLDTRT